MQCNCGGEVCLFVHEVKTQDKKSEWMRYSKVDNAPNPLRIENNRCVSCGRQLVKVFDAKTNALLLER
jgi:uncharacterized protein with PIN domain